MNFTSIFSLKWVPSWSNPLKFGLMKGSFKKDFENNLSFEEFHNIVKEGIKQRNTRTTSIITTETVNPINEKGVRRLSKIVYWPMNYSLHFWKNLSRAFKKSHFE